MLMGFLFFYSWRSNQNEKQSYGSHLSKDKKNLELNQSEEIKKRINVSQHYLQSHRTKTHSIESLEETKRSYFTQGDCICGCNGIPMTLLPEYSIDYEKYRYCPARLKRKQTGFYKNKSGRVVEWIPSGKKRSLQRKKQREQKKLKEKLLQEKEIERKKNAKKKQIEEWILQGDKGNKPLSIEEAKYRKMRTFIGNPCRLGHTERFTRNGDCVICAMTASKLRSAMKRGAYPIKLTEAEKEQVIRIYEEAKRLTKNTGIEHHVDHIKPVSKGGTNHPSNLQILTAKENLSKSDKWEDID